MLLSRHLAHLPDVHLSSGVHPVFSFLLSGAIIVFDNLHSYSSEFVSYFNKAVIKMDELLR